MPVALISTRTSPALGPSRSSSMISSGFFASNATAARVFMCLSPQTSCLSRRRQGSNPAKSPEHLLVGKHCMLTPHVKAADFSLSNFLSAIRKNADRRSATANACVGMQRDADPNCSENNETGLPACYWVGMRAPPFRRPKPNRLRQSNRKEFEMRGVIFAAALAMTGTGGASAQDAAAGEKVFAVCKACHQIGETAKNAVGPVLNGIIGRPAGSYPGYSYSDANKNSGLTWDE